MLCPYCNEEIKDGAKKCKHCGEFLEKEDTKSLENENFTEKVYWKDLSAKIVTSLFWGLVAIWFFAMWSSLEGAWIAIFLGLCCIIPILWVFTKKLILEKDRIKIVKWILFKNFKYIQYHKINDVELSWASSTIIFHTWNDKPTKFSWIQRPNEILEFVQKKINK